MSRTGRSRTAWARKRVSGVSHQVRTEQLGSEKGGWVRRPGTAGVPSIPSPDRCDLCRCRWENVWTNNLATERFEKKSLHSNILAIICLSDIQSHWINFAPYAYWYVADEKFPIGLRTFALNQACREEEHAGGRSLSLLARRPQSHVPL